MLENPYFHNEDAKQERNYWRRVAFWFLFALVIALVLIPLGGCSTTEDPKVCFMSVMGQTEEGYTVVAQQCMTQEAFKELQK